MPVPKHAFLTPEHAAALLFAVDSSPFPADFS